MLTPLMAYILAVLVTGAYLAFHLLQFPKLPLMRADKLWKKGEREAAHTIWLDLMAPLVGRRNLRDLVTVRLHLAAYYWERGVPRSMAEQARRAMEESLIAGRPWQHLVAQTTYGLALAQLGWIDEARRLLEEAETRSLQQGRKRLRTFVRTGLGWVHLGTGSRQVAIDYARAACNDLRTNPGDYAEHPALMVLLGRLCLELGLWDDALARFDEAQAHTPYASQAAVRTEALMYHGQLDLERGLFERAYEVLQEALKLAPKDQPEHATRVHLLLARLFRLTGRHNEARLALEQARTLAAKVDDQDLLRSVALHLAAQHRVQGRYSEGRDLLTRAQTAELSEAPGPGLAAILIAWGEFFLDQHEDREAYAHFKLADRILQSTGGNLWDADLPYRLAILHHRMGLMDRGVQYERDGDALRRRLGITRKPELLRGTAG